MLPNQYGSQLPYGSGGYGNYPKQKGGYGYSSQEDCVDEALRALKKVTGSWLMLILAITCSVTTLLYAVNTVVNFSTVKVLYDVIKIILSIIICIGVWKIFLDNGRNGELTASGFKLVKGVITFRYVLIMIIVLIALAVVFLAVTALSAVNDAIGSMGNEGKEIALNVNLLIFGAIAIIIGAVVVLILFFKSVMGSLSSAKALLETRRIVKNNYYLGAIILIIIGVFKLIGVFVMSAIGGIIETVIGEVFKSDSELSGISNSILSGNSLFSTNWSSIIASVCDMLNYLIGGILIVSYAKKIRAIERAMARPQIGSYR